MKPQALMRDEQAHATAGYEQLIRELVDDPPHQLIMSDEALDVMASLRRHIHDLIQEVAGISSGFQAFLGKLMGYSARLALLLHMANRCSGFRISGETAANVKRLVEDFIIPHALEFYRATGATDGDRVKRVASYIVTCGKDRLTVSDFTRNVADLKGRDPGEVQKMVGPLVASGWLEPETEAPLCKAWKVSPQVRAQMEHRREEEERRKTKLAGLMGAPRKPVARGELGRECR
jgi:hypothetical protein